MNETKEFLRRYGELRRRVDDLKERLKQTVTEKYQTLDGLLRAPKTDGVRVQAGKQSDVVYDTVEKLVDYHDERIKKAIEALRNAEHELDQLQAVIDRAVLSKTERRYIELRYVRGLSVQSVAAEMHYSERYCQKIRENIYMKISENC